MTSGPNVRLGTKRPSMTSNWIRSTPAFSSATHSSPSLEKSQGSTDGAISMGRSEGASGRARSGRGGHDVLGEARPELDRVGRGA